MAHDPIATKMLATATYMPLLQYESKTVASFDPISIPKPKIPTLPDLKWPPPRMITVADSNLFEKFLGDVAIGCSVTLGVTPFLAVVDKAIVQRAAGTHTLLSSGLETITSLLRNPLNFAKSPSFLLMWGVYASTYSTANCLKTLMEHQEYQQRKERETSPIKVHKRHPQTPDTSQSYGKFGVFLGTALVNSSTTLFKDRAYARMFGTTGAAAKVPLVTLGLWASRDFMVIGSSFILPEMVTGHLKEMYPDLDTKDAQKLAQFTLPVMTQFLAGPIQLLGLDFYNRPLANLNVAEAALDRARFLVRGFCSVVAARIARIAPGYGIGGVLNTSWRDSYRDFLIEKEMKELLQQETDVSRLVQHVTERHWDSN